MFTDKEAFYIVKRENQLGLWLVKTLRSSGEFKTKGDNLS